MKARRFMAVVLFCGVTAGVDAVVPPFSRYEVILRRRPFGEPTPAPSAADAVLAAKPPAPPLAKEWRLCSLTRSERRGITVGLVNIRTQNSHLLRAGEKVDDVEVLEVDYEGESVKVRIAGTEDWLFLDGKERGPTAGAPASAAAPVFSSPSRLVPLSYADRLKARREQEKAPKHREIPSPTLTGEQLESYLKQYQMDAIRQGLPALPIPLTKEMDDQLVSEGVLPPQ